MDKASERRKEKRIEQKGTIMVSDETADYWVYAQIGNISDNGLYFESEHSFRPGNKIQFRYDNPPYESFPENHPATVQCNGAGGCPRKNPSSLTLVLVA